MSFATELTPKTVAGMDYDNTNLAQQYGVDPNQTIAAAMDSLAITMRKVAEKVASGQKILFSDAEKKDAAKFLAKR